MASRYTLLLAAIAGLAGCQAATQELFTGSDALAGDPAAGFQAYLQSCVICHGTQLEGGPAGPPLVGQTFMAKWRGKPADQLLTQMRDTMPPKGTTTVATEAYPDLVALLVRANLQGVPDLKSAPVTQRTATTNVTIPRRLPAPLQAFLSSLSPVTEAMLGAPPDGDWLMWRRTFDVAGFSPLRQINRSNVQNLQLAWTLPLQPSTNEIAPLIHDGVLFVYSGGVVLAVEAASGTPLWQYQYRESPLDVDGQTERVKSMALHGHSLFVPTADGHMLALDTRNGKLRWKHSIDGITSGSGLVLSSGPLVAQGVVMIGASLGLKSKGGSFIVGLDAGTGRERWRFHTVARPGTPGGDTWNDAPGDERFGGGVWTIGSYDPELQLAYFGIGNTYTTATLLEPREGAQGTTGNDGLFTDSTVALRPQTGELVWHHQHHRRDVWDQDWAFEQTLVTLGGGTNTRRAVVTMGKTGILEAVAAATGEFLFAHDSGLTNLFLGVDARTGEKRANPQLEPVAQTKLLLCPSQFGARNWPATSLNPATGMLFVPMLESCADFHYMPQARADTASGGTDIRFVARIRPDSDGKLGRIMALNLNSQTVQWTHRQRAPLAGSLLTTAGGLLFMSDLARNFAAYDQGSGAQLWNTQLPAAAESSPVSFAVGNRQYIAVVSGEGSRLGLYNRRLDESLGAPKQEISLMVFALPADGASP